MLISPFTPLFFLDPKVDGVESPYIQTFANTDRILIQLIGQDLIGDDYIGDDEWTLEFVNHQTGNRDYWPLNYWKINNVDYVRFAIISGLSDGVYSVILGCPDFTIESQPFRVTSNEYELAETTLLQYSMSNNRQRNDAVFFIDNMQYFFEFRVPGGFKDNGWTFGIVSEQFKTDNADPIQLYGRESTLRKLTIGRSEGCPIWFGEMVNRILCCNYVYIDGVRYARADGAVPEVTNTLEGINSFIFSQNVQQVVNDELMNRYSTYYKLYGGIYNPDLNRRMTDSAQLILRSLGNTNIRTLDNNKLRNI